VICTLDKLLGKSLDLRVLGKRWWLEKKKNSELISELISEAAEDYFKV